MCQIINSIKVLSANCQGLRNTQKLDDILTYLKEKKINIACLQDTHLLESDIPLLKKFWKGDIFISGHKSNSRGVAILLSSNFEYQVLSFKKDTGGNFVNVLLKLSTMTLNLTSLYGPNSDNPNFFNQIQNLVASESGDYDIICGDFNLVLNPHMDTFNYKHINNPNARQKVLNMIDDLNLSDIYRQFHPTTRRYTWRRKNPVKQARLDFFLASSSILDIVKGCDVKLSYRSDHSMIELELILNHFVKGKGIWKFNNSLLSVKDYLELVNKIIHEEKIKYALPVYDLNYITSTNNKIEMTIEDDAFLEALFLRIRGETIKFSTTKKRISTLIEKNLLKDIETLEASELQSNFELLQDKKKELQDIRDNKLKGNMVRSRLQWLHEGEKPSRFFCNLENKNYIEKTIKRVQTNDGSIVTDQMEVLQHIRDFYANLLQNKDDKLSDINFEDLGLQPKNQDQNIDLGLPLTVNEVGTVLKRMKSNKTPGIDGITSEFLKMFWGKLKCYIVHALNRCFEKGQLSVSLRQSIIVCLPKGNKDRSFVKNWRPIALLSVVYKLASGVIADRLKESLNKIISNCQSGFLKGRYISDSTRLIYDALEIADTQKIPGLIMCIDFEKAFDSLSWKFLYKVLAFFGYSNNFIKWVKLFNTNIKAYVLQCGFLSKEINIERGCRQGDPISSYLFLLGAEILTRLINLNPDIIGLRIREKEFKLTQFADDTTLMLNGTQHSLQSALNTLEVFGNMSGVCAP